MKFIKLYQIQSLKTSMLAQVPACIFMVLILQKQSNKGPLLFSTPFFFCLVLHIFFTDCFPICDHLSYDSGDPDFVIV